MLHHHVTALNARPNMLSVVTDDPQKALSSYVRMIRAYQDLTGATLVTGGTRETTFSDGCTIHIKECEGNCLDENPAFATVSKNV